MVFLLKVYIRAVYTTDGFPVESLHSGSNTTDGFPVESLHSGSNTTDT
jgi:hypothetical protein